ncbi:hypothetical protein [Haliangium sp.]|uniref:hypothetical protein n=1 Tax=Haliangium sp. TaxID=2663208 RepID=UPI003D0CA58E
MTITLENRERRMQVFNLPHDIYCEAVEYCACAATDVTTLLEDARTGERMARTATRRIPASITLLARESRRGLPEAVLRIPEIRRAVDRRALRVLTEREAPAPTGKRTPERKRTPTSAPASEQPQGGHE